METNFSDDMNTIRADDIADANEPEGFDNLESPEDVAEFEAWLDAPISALVARMMYPDDGEEFDRMKAYLKGE